MARRTQKPSINPELSTSIMLIGGIIALLGSLAVAAVIWQRWDDLGVHLGPRSLPAVIISSLVTVILAVASGSWALYKINSLTGSTAVKCIVACLLDALALAILVAFVIVTYCQKAVI